MVGSREKLEALPTKNRGSYEMYAFANIFIQNCSLYVRSFNNITYVLRSTSNKRYTLLRFYSLNTKYLMTAQRVAKIPVVQLRKP